MTGAILRRIGWEQRVYWRNPAAAAFTFAFPLLFLVIFTAINGNGHVEVAGQRVSFAQYFVPGILAFGLISACYTNLAFTITFRRETGLLKRVRGTPLSPRVYLAGVIGNTVVVSLILTTLVTVLGVVAYGITFPARYAGLAATLAAGAFCFSTLGMAVSTVVPNQDAAPAIVNFIVFPLLFISGTFSPVANTSFLGRLAAVFPVRHLNAGMQAVFEPSAGGSGVRAGHLGVLLLWGAAGLVITLRRFRWEPRGT